MKLLDQQALHILYNKHKYGLMNAIMSLLHPVCKSWHTNSFENFCIQFFPTKQYKNQWTISDRC